MMADDNAGKVCFGKNLAKAYSEHTDRLYLKINDSNKLFFNQKYTGPVIRDLDVNRVHMIKVYFDNQLVKSWPLNFSRLHTNSVIIWRSAGAWRMEPVDSFECPRFSACACQRHKNSKPLLLKKLLDKAT
jgi:hypothetical protein